MNIAIEVTSRYEGGCLCGAVRYEAAGKPKYAGLCFCVDCRKASGSAFVPFIGFDAAACRFRGETRIHIARSIRGTEAVRNFCPTCGSLLFGGRVGIDTEHTIYAGSLDDPTLFEPRVALFMRDRPAWAAVPPGLRLFDLMPT
jgi:hypothetical protein